MGKSNKEIIKKKKRIVDLQKYKRIVEGMERFLDKEIDNYNKKESELLKTTYELIKQRTRNLEIEIFNGDETYDTSKII